MHSNTDLFVVNLPPAVPMGQNLHADCIWFKKQRNDFDFLSDNIQAMMTAQIIHLTPRLPRQ